MNPHYSFRSLKFAAFAAAGLSLANFAQADTSLVNGVSGNAIWQDPGVLTAGYEFTLTSAVNVTAFGFFDMTNDTAETGIGNDGLLAAHQVGLWDTSGTLLAHGIVAAGGAGLDDANGYLYTSSITFDSLPGGLLAAGTYILGADVTGSANVVGFDHYTFTGVPLNGASLVGAAYSTSLNSFPNGGISGGYAGSAWLGPNMLSTAAVPEPSTYALLLTGAAMIVVLRRRRA